METQGKKWFLSLDEDIKLKSLQMMLENKKINLFFETVKILLDAPISKGGISTEKIQKVFDDYINLNK
jgi:hypothetical protein